MGEWKSNTDAVREWMHASVEAALNASAERIRDKAVELAPIRKVARAELKAQRRWKYVGEKQAAFLSKGGELGFGGTENFRTPFTVSPQARMRPEKSRVAAAKASLAARHLVFQTAMVGTGKSAKPRVLKLAGGGPLTGRGMQEAKWTVGAFKSKLRSAPPAEGTWLKGGKRTPFAQVIARSTNERGVTTTVVRMGGFLKANIRKGDVEWNGSRATVSITSHAPYSRYVEFPTRRTKAQPFLMPALKQSRSSLKGYFKSNLGG